MKTRELKIKLMEK